MASHGVGTPDLGLGAYRAATIANQLLGYEQYTLPSQQQCFQHFDPKHNSEIKLMSEINLVESQQLNSKVVVKTVVNPFLNQLECSTVIAAFTSKPFIRSKQFT